MFVTSGLLVLCPYIGLYSSFFTNLIISTYFLQVVCCFVVFVFNCFENVERLEITIGC